MPFLKSCLHAHTKDSFRYTIEDLLDVACTEGYDVLAITEHNSVLSPRDYYYLLRKAEKNDILLINGVEATVYKDSKKKEKCHVLVLNIKEYPSKKIKELKDLMLWLDDSKRDEMVVIAPHPCYDIAHSIGEKLLEEYINNFDAIEFSYLYGPERFLLIPEEPNNKAIEIAKKYDKPLIGTGDIHRLNQLWTTYSLIRSEKDVKSLIKVIKNSKFNDCRIAKHFETGCDPDLFNIIVVTRPLELKEILQSINIHRYI